ncbi:MAG: methyltransferase domain-containing protein [Candidatus Omnitrophica bacterium]|nr:methyltransferase domain-containing protein [Candidatus Omnitrophota bacterium]
MAKLLGLSFFYHDSAAALVVDGKVISAVAEERLSRRKHTNEFPKLAIEYCLDSGKIANVNELDAIVFYEKPVTKLFRVIETFVSSWPLSFIPFVSKLPNFLSTKINIRQLIQKNIPGYEGPILFSGHHLSHAATAFFCSPFKDAAILTVDGVGEWETTTLSEGRQDQIKMICAIGFPHSIGLLYSALTAYLGFKVNDAEWKVMGLAPYGEAKYVELFRKLVDMREDGSYQLNLEYFTHQRLSKWPFHEKKWKKLFGFPRRTPDSEIKSCHQDLARSGQKVVEEMILNLACHARKTVKSENLVIAGGVGLNSVANWKIEEEGIYSNVWIQPAAGDDGAAMGAALSASIMAFHDPVGPEMEHAYLGPDFSNGEIKEYLDLNKIPYKELSDEKLVEQIAEAISENKVIGWFRGGMEFGPRALGARSILANPTNSNMKAIVNEKIKFREYFRPFAPAVPLERVHDFFKVPPHASMPFMIKVPQVREEKRGLLPAVTHEDGSGRVQTIRREMNPIYYDLLVALESKIGVPIVLNTSFNVMGEPIVCTPEDAFVCFMKTGIDVLVLGNYVIRKEAALNVNFAEEEPGNQALEGEINLTKATANITEKVLNFYKVLPFNYYSNSIDMCLELLRENRIKEYPIVHKSLEAMSTSEILDVGCGAGWFSISCAHFYHHKVTGLDDNSVAIKQARSVNRLLPSEDRVRFLVADIFKFVPERQFDVVNSLGVLHHTYDCHAAIIKCIQWIKKGGYFHLGLYHHYGRKPFLDFFKHMKEGGSSEADLYQAFKGLNKNITDETHMRSWFRDQVLHVHETQHTYQEIAPLLEKNGLRILSTSINQFNANPKYDEIVEKEKSMEQFSRKVLEKEKRYYPGFFTIWAQKH